ncbi:MAG: hypothetical protein SFV54_10930 [Bryobacteraceae bacterium]|nr:hypothetical protein [Bryobacteraceae bacterium]
MKRTAITFALCLVPAMAGNLPEATLDGALRRLYSFDFAASEDQLARYTAANAGDPLGHALRASGLLFQELNRLNLLGREFIADDEKIAKEDRPQPDRLLRERFREAVRAARATAQAALARQGDDRNALLALCIAIGAERDYAALVDKRLRASMEYVKEGQGYANRLLKIDPNAYDAYVTTGFSEYLLGSLPFFLKWFVKVDGAQGSKDAGLRQLEVAATRGKYLKSFAQLLLANFYLREKKAGMSRRWLKELAREYPENKLFQAELAKLNRTAD